MNRRDFLKSCFYSGSILSLAGSAKSGLSLSNKTVDLNIGKRRPNVIYILADDLGYRELGAYGQKKIRTPNIDRLAAEGMSFMNHYTGNAICAPARGSVMCGKHMGHAFIRDNYEINGYQLPLPAGTTTVAHIFRQAGFTTGAMGKWGLGGPGTTGEPGKMGFDLFFGYLGQAQAHYYYPPYLWRNTDKVYFEGNANTSGTHYSHDYMVKEALGFVQENRDRPFFLFLPFTIPHVSLQVPQDSLDEYLAEGWPEIPYPGGHYTGHDTPRAAYAAMITRMDEGVGQIMNLLEKLGIEDDTLIMFTGDNGTTYCCGVDYDFFDSVGNLRGLKGQLYEGGIREPLVCRWPGKIRPGTTTDHISAFYDFLPTVCEILGRPVPEWTDGISFLPTLLGRPDKQQVHEYLYWELKGYGAQQAVRMGKWKGYRKDVWNNPNPVLELYDLDNDISESNNVASANPDIVSRIEQIMSQAHVYSPEFPLLNSEKS